MSNQNAPHYERIDLSKIPPRRSEPAISGAGLSGGIRFAQWILVAGFAIGPPIYLAYNPAAFTPLVDTLFSLFLFLLAYWIGSTKDAEWVAQRVTDRWLPQAESVVFRLMTLRANVERFAEQSQISCAKAECDLPELKGEPMRAVRIKFKTECESNATRLVDICHQLDDVIEDWARFISANCQGVDCDRIFRKMEERKSELRNELQTQSIVVEPTAAVQSQETTY
ncbi:MAG: hypothetical protein K1X74_14200 [Pirellulales bacterium]|nr:hypothetical protein [Pirellulales bacterium]